MPFWDFFGATFIGKAILKVTAPLPAGAGAGDDCKYALACMSLCSVLGHGPAAGCAAALHFTTKVEQCGRVEADWHSQQTSHAARRCKGTCMQASGLLQKL